MEELAREGCYPSNSYLPALGRGFAAFERGAISIAIEALALLTGETHALAAAARSRPIEFTLLNTEAKRISPASYIS